MIDTLARRYTVIAPDLLGHGLSDKPRADYSVGGYANGMRDLLTVLGIDKVTVVGHSFGGGVAMQFAYQFPERTERMVLVASGGLGAEVSPRDPRGVDPGFHPVMGVLTLPGVRHVGCAGLRGLSRLPGRATRDLDEVADDLRQLPGPGGPPRDPSRREGRRRLARPDRVDGRPGLPDPGDADGGPVGRARPGDPGQPRREGGRSWPRRPGSGHPQRRALPAQGPPAAVRPDRPRLRAVDAAGDVLPGKFRTLLRPASRPAAASVTTVTAAPDARGRSRTTLTAGSAPRTCGVRGAC